MVELLEGVHVELPVGAHLGPVEPPFGHLVEGVAPQGGHHRSEELGQRLLGLGGQVDEDEALPHVAVHGHQPVVVLVEVEELVLLLDEVEGAVEVVAPAVVLAGELPADPGGLLLGEVVPHQLVAPVAADVVEGPDLTLHVAHHDHRGLGDLDLLGEVAPGPRQEIDPPHVQPGALEDRLHLELVELGRDGVLVGDGPGPEVGVVLRPAAFGRLRPSSHRWSPCCSAARASSRRHPRRRPKVLIT